ncbi:phosphate ABC transporter membrane protein 2, PhoT family (TC 3.A.1.7.1) [Caldanaerovirga acetigignens]|jgi:phosphate transport system permease protein|uniref:Phosphate transport system permease protein PstA n=1 Tax=Caldanaerovirga acetigignens TaxID=447595 RepID=A0A1M7ITL6_9FIRM|nr:phosphate ABC transporter permease PstA [Caldanaerovirga acetigignens]SHM43958.1 phosphate ABC transporter membrane protein 2, PhoT family (TC 3.A.1.7.1) [Caldanaerovirga acetigignens]
MSAQEVKFRPRLERRKWIDATSKFAFAGSAFFGVTVLFVLLFRIILDSLGWLDLQFLTSFPSRFPEKAGIFPALLGTIYVILITAAFSIPIGIAAAIFLEEYAKKNKLVSFIQLNIYNLAGVPSIVYGILGLTVFVRWMKLGRSLLAGGLTMGILVLPVVIVSAQEAIRAVPDSWREAAYALGATKWQTVRYVVLPTALPGIMTGVILALSRAIGETAPLIPIGALTFIRTLPKSPFDSFTVLPIQIYNWTSRPQEDFRAIAAAAIVVLLFVLLSMNFVAIMIRNKYQRRIKEV